MQAVSLIRSYYEMRYHRSVIRPYHFDVRHDTHRFVLCLPTAILIRSRLPGIPVLAQRVLRLEIRPQERHCCPRLLDWLPLYSRRQRCYY